MSSLLSDDLRSNPLFEGFADQQLDDIAGRFIPMEVDIGTVLARRGDFAYHFFLVCSGLVVVVIDEQVMATLGPGDVFGEIGVLRRGRRTADVVALTPLRLATMTIWEFNEAGAQIPEFLDRARTTAEDRLARG
jgi:CRP-like cAMP-binding protein